MNNDDLRLLISEKSIKGIAEDIAPACLDPHPDVVDARLNAMKRLGERLRHPLDCDLLRAGIETERKIGKHPALGMPYGKRRPTRDEIGLREAELWAERGTCPRRQVGCVITDVHGRVIAHGYNGVASGRPHCNEGHPCPGAGFPSGEGLDKCEAIHAEQNACLMLRDPWAADTVYITASPCLSCVKLLLGTSAKRIVCRELYPHSDAIEWWGRAGRQLTQLNSDGTQLDYGTPV